MMNWPSLSAIFAHCFDDSIFNFRKADGIAYFVFYILIPCLVTSFSLMSYPDGHVERVYCYVSILISALNCIYDAFNRWTECRSRKNAKLFVIILGAGIITVYCFVMIFSMLLLEDDRLRHDGFLISYFLVIVIALVDIVGCFMKDIALGFCINQTWKDVEQK